MVFRLDSDRADAARAGFGCFKAIKYSVSKAAGKIDQYFVSAQNNCIKYKTFPLTPCSGRRIETVEMGNLGTMGRGVGRSVVRKNDLAPWVVVGVLSTVVVSKAAAADSPTNSVPAPGVEKSAAQTWNWHVQNTDIVQGDPGFPAKYSGPNSLNSQGEVRESVSVDLYAGVRLWPGAEAHMDGLGCRQGFGLSQTRCGVEGFPNLASPSALVRRSPT